MLVSVSTKEEVNLLLKKRGIKQYIWYSVLLCKEMMLKYYNRIHGNTTQLKNKFLMLSCDQVTYERNL